MTVVLAGYCAGCLLPASHTKHRGRLVTFIYFVGVLLDRRFQKTQGLAVSLGIGKVQYQFFCTVHATCQACLVGFIGFVGRNDSNMLFSLLQVQPNLGFEQRHKQ